MSKCICAERCHREIARSKEMTLKGEIPEEMEGILQGLQDWSAELRLIEAGNTCGDCSR